MKRKLLFPMAMMALVPIHSLIAADYELGLECPAEITGAVGEVKSFDVYAILASAPEALPVMNWSISLGVSGGTVKSVEVGGLHVATVFDHDGNRATPPIDDPSDFDLADADIHWEGMAALPADPGKKGAVSAVVLGIQPLRVLKPGTSQRVLRLSLEATVPSEVILRFEDGYPRNTVPIINRLTVAGEWVIPALGECAIPVRTSGGRQLPGDANQDGTLDISDAAWLLGHLFLGTPGTEVLPCEHGTASSPGAGELALINFNGDDRIDISDPLSMLAWHGLRADRRMSGSVPVA